MKWTKNRPQREGYFWMKFSKYGQPQIVKVSVYSNQYYVMMDTTPTEMWSNLFKETYWSDTPIERPEE